MQSFLEQFNPVVQTLFGTGFTWLMTALGASIVFFAKNLDRRLNDGMLGFAAGVMIAASFWSLLAPAIEMSDGDWREALIGFLAGGAFLYLIDNIAHCQCMSLSGAENECLLLLVDL